MPNASYHKALTCKMCGGPRTDLSRHVCVSCAPAWNAIHPYAERLALVSEWTTLPNGVRVRTVGDVAG
jgi:hypothetical protein